MVVAIPLHQTELLELSDITEKIGALVAMTIGQIFLIVPMVPLVLMQHLVVQDEIIILFLELQMFN
jgi:hypothetical protein